MFDQHQNFQNAIRKKRARIEEISLILAQPIPKGASSGFRRRIIEERLHLADAITELDAEDARLTSRRTVSETHALPDANNSSRCGNCFHEMAGHELGLGRCLFTPDGRLSTEVGPAPSLCSCEHFQEAVSRPIPVAELNKMLAGRELVPSRAGHLRKKAPTAGNASGLVSPVIFTHDRPPEVQHRAMDYPHHYPSQARARVEAERLKARKDLDLKRKKVPWSRYGPTMADEANLREYILRVFLVFAQEACKLGLGGVWTLDEIRPTINEFLRRFTIEAYSNDGHDRAGRKLREMICNWSGSVLPEVRREFEESAQWHQFEDKLLAVAEAQIGEDCPPRKVDATGRGATSTTSGNTTDRPVFTHSDSYQKIDFRGKDYDLSRHLRAAAVVRFLHDRHKKGERRVSSAEIRNAIGLTYGGNMYDWFRRTGLWKTLVIEVETGIYQLDIPITDR